LITISTTGRRLKSFSVIVKWLIGIIVVVLALLVADLQTVATWWRRGVAIECRTRDQEVAGSSLGRALGRKNSGQVSHTYVPLSPSSITWYWPKGGDA